jgi:hypothetical protein
LLQRLLQFAHDGGVADNVALQAIRDAVDRAMGNPTTTAKVFEPARPTSAGFGCMTSADA